MLGVLSLMNPIGTMLGFVLPLVVVPALVVNDKTNTTKKDSTRSGFFWLMILELGLTLASLALLAIFFKETSSKGQTMVEKEYEDVEEEFHPRRLSVSDPLFEITAYSMLTKST